MPSTIRHATLADLDAAYHVEHLAFPTALAASRANIKIRLERFPQGFIVAIDDGQITGHIMSGATDKDDISDPELKALGGHDPDGKNLVIFAVAVHPQYQRKGIASAMMAGYIKWARQQPQYTAILLICKTHLIAFYESFGFEKVGLSASTHGGEQWYEMRYTIKK